MTEQSPFAYTIVSLLDRVTELLSHAGVDEGRLKAETLLAHRLRVPRLELGFVMERHVADRISEEVLKGAAWMAQGMPLQHVLGDTMFMDLLLKTDRRALIPRPETEELVAHVLACDELWHGEPVIADVGTGSGCVAISLALAHREASVIASDVSAEALELARENAEKNEADGLIRFIHADLFTGCREEQLDAVVSNPPYVSTAEYEALPIDIRGFEPREALDGGEDGLDIIRELIPAAWRALKGGGWLFLEIGEDQGESVLELMKRAGFEKSEIRQDLNGRDRIAVGQKT